jgi:hypothetical protein
MTRCPKGAQDGDMQAVLLTLAMLGLMAGALVVLARFWPRSSRLTGYRISRRDAAAGEVPPVPEDDDARWRWKDRPR